MREGAQLVTKAAMATSATMHIAFGKNAGKKVRRIGHGFGIEDEHALVKGKLFIRQWVHGSCKPLCWRR